MRMLLRGTKLEKTTDFQNTRKGINSVDITKTRLTPTFPQMLPIKEKPLNPQWIKGLFRTRGGT